VADTVAEGTKIQVTAAFEADGRQTVSAPVEVTVLEKNAVTVTPVAAGSATTVEAGQDVTFTLTVTDKDGKAITPTKKTWSMTVTPGVSRTRAAVPIDASIDENGTLHVGDTIMDNWTITVKCAIEYTDPEDSSKTLTADGSTVVTVNGPDHVVITSPADNVTTVAQGSTLNMTAQLKRADNSNYSSNKVVWSLSGNTKATIDENTGVLTVNDEAVDTPLTVTATACANENKTATKILTIGGVQTVEITPSATTTTQGANTLTLTAKVKDIAGNDFSNQKVNWSVSGGSGNSTITVDESTGVATLNVDWDEAVGTITVTATSQADTSKSDTENITVGYAPATEVVFTKKIDSMVKGSSYTFEVSVKRGDGKPCHNQAVTWTSSDPSVMSVNSNGRVTNITNAKSVTITATSTATLDGSPVSASTIVKPGTGGAVGI